MLQIELLTPCLWVISTVTGIRICRCIGRVAENGSFYVADVDGDGQDDFIVKWHHENTNDVNFLTYRWTDNGLTVVRSATFTTVIPYFNAS